MNLLSEEKPRFAFWIVCVILLAVAVHYALVPKLPSGDSNGLLHFYEKQIVLSTNDCKQLSTDLESTNPTRLALWKLYFERAAQGKIVSSRPVLDFRDVLAVYNDQYKSHEKPARSNYFGVLLTALADKQPSNAITVNELIGYLGEPDETSNSYNDKTMLYNFSASGRNAIGSVKIESNAVSSIAIQFTGETR